MEQLRRPGLDDQQLEAAVAVIAMFNYFTRVADATGIGFDYASPLPAFKPDRTQVSAPRPVLPRAAAAVPGHPEIRHARACARRGRRGRSRLPAGRRRAAQPQFLDRLLLAGVAAREAGDYAAAEALSRHAHDDGRHVLARFARKLSREPWQMQAGDLDELRGSGYSEVAVLRAISVTAHQNAHSRLSAGLAAAAAAKPDGTASTALIG